MAFKFVALLALVAAAQAGVLAPVATYAAAPVLAKTVVSADYDPNPQYSYSYSVADALTGDNKQQEESRNGDVVQGSYSLVEADGTRRVVQYTADPINGFNAVVSKEGTPVVAAPVVRKVVAPVVARVAAPAIAYQAAPALTYQAAPAVAYHAAPVARLAAPIARVAYSAPTVHSYQAAPAVAYHAAAPAVAYHAAAPAVAYHAAPAVVNTQFSSPYATYVH